MSKRLWIILASALLVAAGGCAEQHQEPAAKAAGPLPVPSLRRNWAVDAGSRAEPVRALYVRGESLFAYTPSGTSFVLDRGSGRMLHADTIPGGGVGLRAPIVLKDKIIYPTLTSLYLYDTRGNLTRTIPLEYPLSAGAVGVKDLVFTAEAVPGGARGVAIDLSKKLGAVAWEYLIYNSGMRATPAALNDIAFMAGEDGSVAALSVSNREPIWPLKSGPRTGVFMTGGPVLGDLAADDTGVYVASMDSKLYCLNRNNGKVKWQYYAEAALAAGPVLTKDTVFEQVPGIGLVAIDKTEALDKSKPATYDRTPRWVAADATQFLAEDDKYVYVRRGDDRISARDKITGQEAFRSKRNDFAAFASNPADGTVYAATKAGRVMAINAVLEPGLVGEIVMNANAGPGSVGSGIHSP